MPPDWALRLMPKKSSTYQRKHVSQSVTHISRYGQIYNVQLSEEGTTFLSPSMGVKLPGCDLSTLAKPLASPAGLHHIEKLDQPSYTKKETNRKTDY
jgi:hypothetical protein